MASDENTRYNTALHELSRLVQRRNQYLMRLDTLASLPLSIGPSSGHIAEFDATGARRLLDSIESETQLIRQVAQDVNRLAEECGLPPVQWMPLPEARESAVDADA